MPRAVTREIFHKTIVRRWTVGRSWSSSLFVYGRCLQWVDTGPPRALAASGGKRRRLRLSWRVSHAEWMRKAERAALSLRAATTGKPGAGHSVYVILLHDPRFGERWGLYVGQTSRDPDWRFDQHKAGYKASAAVKRFGVRLLPELVEHLNPLSRRESLVLEAALAKVFRDSGVPWVEGGH